MEPNQQTFEPNQQILREHVEAVFPTVPGNRAYAAPEETLDALAALAAVWQQERAAKQKPLAYAPPALSTVRLSTALTRSEAPT